MSLFWGKTRHLGPRRPQSLRGHLRKLVPELRQEMGFYQFNELRHAADRDSDAVVALVSVQRSGYPPLPLQQFDEASLGVLTELLSVQIHRTP